MRLPKGFAFESLFWMYSRGVVSEKAAAQLVPVIGAAGGALVNTVFISHYQDMARGHFAVRRLERIHGIEPVRLAYEAL